MKPFGYAIIISKFFKKNRLTFVSLGSMFLLVSEILSKGSLSTESN